MTVFYRPTGAAVIPAAPLFLLLFPPLLFLLFRRCYSITAE
jgi:hypothetical protein